MSFEVLGLLKKASEILDRQNISYMVSGSVALGCYAVSRSTRDIDVVLELDAQQVEGFLSEFSSFYLYEPTVIEEIKRKGMFNAIDHESGFKIDFILRKNGRYAQNAFSRRYLFTDWGFPFWIISLEDLIIAKLVWIQDYQSSVQINDINALLLNPEIDFSYLWHSIQDLQLDTFNIIPQ
jgi:hypothetical protein